MVVRSPYPAVAVPDVPVTTLVLENAASRGAKPALIDVATGRVLTYGDLAAAMPRVAAGLRHRGDQLSGGEQQMLASGRTLVTNPELLLMDEPSEGLAPLLIRELAAVIRELKAAGISILLVEQRLSFALELADYVYIMSNGRVVHASTPQALMDDAEVKARHLGV